MSPAGCLDMRNIIFLSRSLCSTAAQACIIYLYALHNASPDVITRLLLPQPCADGPLHTGASTLYCYYYNIIIKNNTLLVLTQHTRYIHTRVYRGRKQCRDVSRRTGGLRGSSAQRVYSVYSVRSGPCPGA